jgi:uncharacterized membrane protein
LSVGLALIAAAVVLGAAITVLFEQVGRRKFDVVAFCAVWSWVQLAGSLFCVNWRALPVGWERQIAPLALAMLFCGILNGLTAASMIGAMRYGHAALSNALAQSGMLLTFAFSVVVWKERASAVNGIGILLILAMFFLGAARRDEDGQASGRRGRWLAWVMTGFFSAGACQILYLLPSRWYGYEGLQPFRPILMLVAQSVFLQAVVLAARKRVTREMVPTAVWGAAVALGYLAFMLMAANAMAMIHAVGAVYPLASAGAIILFSFYSRYVLREAYTVWSKVGLAAGALGILLICVRG